MKVTPRPACSCDKCKSMCTRCPCEPTPKQAVALIEAGYADRLMKVKHYNELKIMPARVGCEGKYTEEPWGTCTFYKDGLCELHDTGLKPLGATAVLHDGQVPDWLFDTLRKLWERDGYKAFGLWHRKVAR